MNKKSIALKNKRILGTRIDAINYSDAVTRIIACTSSRESSYLCAANVHMVMEGYDQPQFKDIVNNAVLVTPDGVPLVWGLRLLGIKKATRVYGPTLTLHVCETAAKHGIPIGLYGGTEESLTAFISFLNNRFPGIRVVCAIAPPFRSLTEIEDNAYVKQIVESGARILFVGIGCPKQEVWMAQHVSKISAVMLGVGAAFDFHSGRVRQAPSFIQRIGLEWFYRFLMEPRRLWKRYLKHNPRFVVLFGIQLLKTKLRLKQV